MIDNSGVWNTVKDAYEANRVSVSKGDNFIEIYDGAVSREVCDELVKMFEHLDAKGETQAGITSSRPDRSVKNSSDLGIGQAFLDNPEYAQYTSILTRTVAPCLADHLVQYMMKYDSLLPMLHQMPDGTTFTHGEMMSDPQKAKQHMISKMSLLSMQIQRYNPPGQGFYAWHYESANPRTVNRILFPILYLNDVESGGETEFYHWDVEVKPVAGRLIIAPGGFTHMHRMKTTPLSNAKYILTSWFTMQMTESR